MLKSLKYFFISIGFIFILGCSNKSTSNTTKIVVPLDKNTTIKNNNEPNTEPNKKPNKVNILDTTLPIISVINSNIRVEVGTNYVDKGATALDNKDGDITSTIVVKNNVNTNLIGVYTVLYNVTDKSGNKAIEKTRTVTVSDTTIPVITIVNSNITVELGTTYIDKGVTANDNKDGNITSKIVVSNGVNSNVIGVYTISYNVTDKSGNKAIQKIKTVTVSDTSNPVFSTPTLTVNIKENQLRAFTLFANDISTLSYFIESGDSSNFNVNSSTGVVRFKVEADFETLNSYSFVARARDIAGNEVTQGISINILDIFEGVKKSGQIKSYNETAVEVTDNSLKDDGFYKSGITPSYSKNDINHTVTDNVTGLMWQNDENISKPWITLANYNAKDYNNTSGDTATTYCKNLTLSGFNDWRVPTINELEGIVEENKLNPTIDTNYFKFVTLTVAYWSSTPYAHPRESMWIVSFFNGYIGTDYKYEQRYIRCVR